MTKSPDTCKHGTCEEPRNLASKYCNLHATPRSESVSPRLCASDDFHANYSYPADGSFDYPVYDAQIKKSAAKFGVRWEDLDSFERRVNRLASGR